VRQAVQEVVIAAQQRARACGDHVGLRLRQGLESRRRSCCRVVVHQPVQSNRPQRWQPRLVGDRQQRRGSLGFVCRSDAKGSIRRTRKQSSFAALQCQSKAAAPHTPQWCMQRSLTAYSPLNLGCLTMVGMKPQPYAALHAGHQDCRVCCCWRHGPAGISHSKADGIPASAVPNLGG